MPGEAMNKRSGKDYLAVQSVNIVFVGGGRGCYEILRLLDSYNPARLKPTILGVVDPESNGVGIKYARKLGYPTSNDVGVYLKDPRVDLIVELTGQDEVLERINAEKLPSIKVLNHLAALFLWDIIDIQEQKIHLEEKISTLDTMVAVGEIAYKLTHELRNPLLVVGGLVRRMMTRTDLPHGIRKRFKQLAQHVQHMENVMSDICDVVRPMNPHYTLTDMNDFFRKWCNNVRTEARYAGADLISMIEPDLPTMYVDPLLLRQAMWHILENSLDAMGEKGGTVYIDVQVCWDEISIQLSDSGEQFCSLSPLQAVQPFTTTKSGRMGLGLSLCRQIILDHGGELKLIQNAYGGCTVIILLPIKFDNPAENNNSEALAS